ncbi:MAG: hypothetical protein LBS90_09230 [Oscillospiraceae bacterium]|jgi:hypothetical protein|nr:hypothetical protein [Oscillospiraceae bacterium]
MAVAALVLGIISAVFAVFLPFLGWIGIIVGIVGIILGVISRKNGGGGKATAGLVLAIIGTALAAIFWIACAVCISSAGLSGLV